MGGATYADAAAAELSRLERILAKRKGAQGYEGSVKSIIAQIAQLKAE